MNPAQGDGRFPTTSWTLIARLQSPDADTARRALDELCAQYHFPLYCVIRRRGLAHHDAEDALHDFLAKLLRLETFAEADAAKGRLRAFLGTALARFLANWHRDHAARAREVSLDIAPPGRDGSPSRPSDDEARYEAAHFPDHETPERLFDRQWARALIEHVFQRLAAQYVERGKLHVFTTLSPVLRAGGSLRGEDTPGLAATLGLNEAALRKTVQRLLRDYRTLLEEEVLQTVESREEVEAEIAHLYAAFRKG
jgi:RNA polymerase sigma-70 factor (ECF subfamily)